MITTEARDLIKLHLDKKKRGNSGFSLRVFARKLGVTPAYVSGFLNGRKPVPTARVEEIAKVLDMDDFAKRKLRIALSLESDLNPSLPKRKSAESYFPLAKQEFTLLRNWYLIPILDLATCSDFIAEENWIAARLGITPAEAGIALNELLHRGLIEKDAQGNWRKVTSRIRLAAGGSRSEIRNFHTQMLRRASDELQKKTEQEDFALREIFGLTLAMNPANLERAKQRLTEALHEVAEILAEGECTEVYQLQAQLFPHTKRR